MQIKQITRMVHETASRHEIKEYDIVLSDDNVKASVNNEYVIIKQTEIDNDVRFNLNQLFRAAMCS